MYWNILEVGLALIAACLPSLGVIFTTTSILSAVRSVRSVWSLRSSQESLKGNIRQERGPYTDLEHNSLASSRARSAKLGVDTAEVEYDLHTVAPVK